MSLSQLNAQARASEYRGRATHMALAYMSSSARNGSSSNSAWLKVEIEGGDTYGIAMQTTPGRFTYSRTDAAPVAQDCFQPCTHVIQQDLQWRHSIERVKADQLAGGPKLQCSVTRSSSSSNNTATPHVDTFGGTLVWKAINELVLQQRGWTLSFRYSASTGTLRLTSAEYDVRLGEQAMRDLALMHSAAAAAPPAAAAHSKTKHTLKEAEAAVEEYKQMAQTAAVQATGEQQAEAENEVGL
jgi:hypothetical protein